MNNSLQSKVTYLQMCLSDLSSGDMPT